MVLQVSSKVSTGLDAGITSSIFSKLRLQHHRLVLLQQHTCITGQENITKDGAGIKSPSTRCITLSRAKQMLDEEMARRDTQQPSAGTITKLLPHHFIASRMLVPTPLPSSYLKGSSTAELQKPHDARCDRALAFCPSFAEQERSWRQELVHQCDEFMT